MAKKGWDEHPVGGTAVFPVTGMRTGVAMQGQAGVIRVEYGTEPTLEKRLAKQFLLTPKQVRLLGDALTALADKLEAEGGAEESTEILN